MVLVVTQLLTEVSTRNIPGGGGEAPPARKADNLTAISRLSGQCGILDVSRPIAVIALFFFCSVFIVCDVSFNVCVALCAVFCYLCVRCIHCV
jgi:hypothetical protein